MRFRKSEGLTPSEKVLADLCEESFLALWTYPNLFKKPQKELADLVVIFRDDVIIFSDKSCSYPQTGNAQLDWARWYRRAIDESAHQLGQAERWIRSFPNQIFLDARCEERLPVSLPSPGQLQVHRICVTTGASARSFAETGTEGLGVDVNTVDDARPFFVGHNSKTKGWTHVFDERSLATVLSELSTTPDFVAYLNAKTIALDGGELQGAQAEVDLMGLYLWNNRSFPPVGAPYSVRSDFWRHVEREPAFIRGRAENRVSELWDRLIKNVTTDYLSENLEFGNELEMGDYEKVARIMGSESRFSRRLLSKMILARAVKAKGGKIGSLLPSGSDEVTYALLIGTGAPDADYPAYRLARSQELQLRCLAAKAARPNSRYILGIGLDAAGVKKSSEDFVYMDTDSWGEVELANAKKVQEEMGYYMPGVAIESRHIEDEYPEN